MKKEIKVVIGANFGDEGKGLMTDYFCHELSKNNYNVLNIRYNGGAQAGHNVVTPEGKQHVFHHFGAGSFNPGVDTYLSEDFILNPIIFCQEIDELKELGIQPKVYIHKNCRITTPYDMMLNQIFERLRGNERHGSCGLGINETVLRCTSPFGIHNWQDVRAKDMHLMGRRFIQAIRRDYVTKRLSSIPDIKALTREELDHLNDPKIIENYLAQLDCMQTYCTIVNDSIINNYDKIVFEGAQGLLLDSDHLVFAPHLTSSKTGSYNPKKILLESKLENEDIEFCYVTRPYFTRHGNGPFPTECDKEENPFFKHLKEEHNLENEFQGRFRYGYFDTGLFDNAIAADRLFLRLAFPNSRDSIAVTHMDETDGMFIFDPENFPYNREKYYFYQYQSDGETRDHVKKTWFPAM